MKIGVGLITHERFNRFKESFENLLKNRRDIDTIIIVDDASVKDREKYDEYFKTILDSNILVWTNKVNLGVGASKNKIMKYFMEHDFDWFFTIEEDINVQSPDTFIKYIETAQRTGIHYLNFGLHGELNKQHEPKFTEDVKLWQHLVGAFTSYSRELVNDVGYHDTVFLNALEHVDYYYRCMAKYPELYHFWEFPDVIDSVDLIKEQEGAIDDSSIRQRSDWAFNVLKARNYFIIKHGVHFVAIPRVYDGKRNIA